MTTSLSEMDILGWIRDGEAARVEEAFSRLSAAEVAEILRGLPPEERAIAFRTLSPERAAEVVPELSAAAGEALLANLTDEETGRLLAELAPDDRTELLEELPDPVTEKLMGLLTPEDLKETRTLLAWPEESVGRLMTPDLISVRAAMTVDEVLQSLREADPDAETIYYVYVVDEEGRLSGVLSLRQLIVSAPDLPVREIMDREVARIAADADQEEAARLMAGRDLSVVPVVDQGERLVGIITVDDVLDVMEEEATEDIHSLGAVGHGPAPGLRAGLRDATFGMIYRARVPWLLLLVFMNIFSGQGIAYFEDTLEAMIALAFFLPLLIDSGGNAGTQSATLMVRALATGDVKMRDWFRMFGREITIALALGLSMALAVFGIGIWRGGPELGWIVSLTMISVVTFGSLVGMLLPFGLERLKLDPATASAPLITSIADIGGVIIYFSIATAMLQV